MLFLRPLVRLSAILILIALLAFASSFHHTAAYSATTWGASGQTDIIETHRSLSEAQYDTLWRENTGMHAGTRCVETTYFGAGVDSTEIATGCFYQSVAGLHNSYGNMLVSPDTDPDNANRATLMEQGNTQFVPLGTTGMFLEMRSSLEGGYILSIRGADNVRLITEKVEIEREDGTTAPAYSSHFAEPADLMLRGEDGNPWTIDGNAPYAGMWLSANGRYFLIAHEERQTVLRIDLETLLVSAFDYSLDTDGEDTHAFFAVNDVGVIAANVFGHQPRIILDQCANREAYVSTPVSCPVKTVGADLANDPPGTDGFYARFVEFDADGTLLMYDGNNDVYRAYPPGIYERGMRYLALGDSYASGEGARQYYAGTDRDENRCHLSRVSYPFLLGERLDLPSTNSVACSGARIHNITGPENQTLDLEDLTRTNQYDFQQTDPELDEYLPGRGMQADFLDTIDELRADVVTVSVSGNDANFAAFITECILAGTCFETDAERASLVYTMNQQYDRLVEMYRELRKSTAEGGRTYVVGYPDIVAYGQWCGVHVKLNSSEITLVRQLTQYLNDIIESAALAAGVTYVDAFETFNDHRLCEQGSPAVHGVTINLDRAALRDIELLLDTRKWSELAKFMQESYHPNDLGHRLLASTISDQTDGLTVPDPRPRHDPSPPRMQDAVERSIIEDGSVLDNYVTALYYTKAFGGDVILREEQVHGIIDSGRYHELSPDSPFVVQMYSDPVDLGTFMTDSQGILNFTATVPASVPAGYHRLRIFGTDASGRPIEFRQIVYVAASATDWDGDGTPNDQQRCIIALQNDDGSLDNDWCPEPVLEPVEPDPEPEPPTPTPRPCEALPFWRRLLCLILPWLYSTGRFN